MERALEFVKSDGILGFRLGDKKDEVFSKIKTHSLLADEEINEELEAFESEFRSDSNVIVVAQGMFEDISSIFLSLNRSGVLDMIIVNIRFNPMVDAEQHINQLKDGVSLLLRQEPISVCHNLYTWQFRNHCVTLSYGTDFDVTDEICLSFSIEKHM